MRLKAAQFTLTSQSKTFKKKLLWGLIVCAGFFLCTAVYFARSDSLDLVNKIALLLVGFALGIGLFCYLKLFGLDQTHTGRELIIKLGGQSLLEELENLAKDLDKAERALSQRSTGEKADQLRALSRGLEKRYLAVSELLETPSESTVTIATERMRKPLKVGDGRIAYDSYPQILAPLISE